MKKAAFSGSLLSNLNSVLTKTGQSGGQYAHTARLGTQHFGQASKAT